MAEMFRALGLPEVNAVRPPVKIPTIRSTVELSRGSPGPGSLSRGNFRSAVGESSINVASRKFLNFDDSRGNVSSSGSAGSECSKASREDTHNSKYCRAVPGEPGTRLTL